MSLTLRIVLIVVSLCTLLFIGKKVQNSKVRLEDSLFWFLFAVLLFVVSLFPQIFYALSDLSGIMAPVNLVFLFFIFVLLIKCFSMSMHISQLDTKVKEITQKFAIEQMERHALDAELKRVCAQMQQGETEAQQTDPAQGQPSETSQQETSED